MTVKIKTFYYEVNVMLKQEFAKLSESVSVYTN